MYHLLYNSSGALLVVLFAFTATAQLGLPSCAGGCIPVELGGCSTLDYRCICSNEQFITNISCCVAQNCDAADQEETIKIAAGVCSANAGVTLPTTATCASTASSTGGSSGASATTASGSSSSAGTSNGPAVTASSLSNTSSSTDGSSSSAGGPTTTPSGSGSGMSSTTAPSTQSTGGASSNIKGVGLGAGIAALVAAL